MAQYGFVPRGNTADRLQLAALQPDGSDGGGGSGCQPALLSLDRMLGCLGSEERVAAALSGQDPYAYAALKSLQFAADDAAAAPLGQQLSLAERLHAELAAEAAAWPSSLQQDGELLQRWAEDAAAAGGGAHNGGIDARLVAAVEYRLQRKALVSTCRQLLLDFMEETSPGSGSG
jgi:hypothetical protein